MRYLLNSAVLTAEGVYTYRYLSLAEAVEWLRTGEWVSFIGYAQNAAVVERLSGRPCPVTKEQATMVPGDEALVMRLPYRVPDPATKGAAVEISDEEWQWGILRLHAWGHCDAYGHEPRW